MSGIPCRLRVYGTVFFVLALLCACAGRGAGPAALPVLTSSVDRDAGNGARSRIAAFAGDVVAIDAGGAAGGGFAADEDYRPNGTWAMTSAKVIDTTGVSDPAPQSVYQTARAGSLIAYTIPGLEPGGTYALRLDFAETFWTEPGRRAFDIDINGTRVSTGFDIVAAASKPNKAVARTFSATAGSNGTIAIALTAVRDTALISGIEVAPAAGGSASPSPSPTPLGINHILILGQSLTLGSYGLPALTTVQPFENVMFNTGILTGNQSNAYGLTGFVPLVERVFPDSDHGETGWAGAANTATALARADDLRGVPPPYDDYRILISDNGSSGQGYATLARGTPQYAVGLQQVAAGHRIAAGLGLSHVVRALFVQHGERDQDIDNPHYEADLEAWQADYQADIEAITAQTAPVPMFVSQLSGNWGAIGTNGNAALIPQAQFQASLDEPTKIYLVGPKYMLTFSDGVHLTNASYRQMGEYFGKAYHAVVIEGKPWFPLRPQPASIVCTAHTVDVAFDVPVPPLVLDTTLVAKTGSYGFSFVNGAGKDVPISSVALGTGSTVHIELGAAIVGSNNRLRYAYAPAEGKTCAPGALTCNGRLTGPRGNVRDSDATPSLYGNKLYNWAIQFEEPCVDSVPAAFR